MAISGRRVVVITGASAGVGRAAARGFAARGDAIGLIARGRDGLDAAVKEIDALGSRAHAVVCDVADADAVEAAAEEIERELGPIDVWVNNAMTAVFAPFRETTAEEFKRVTEVVYLGTVYGTMAALRRMAARDSGTIVQVGSALAHRAIPLQAAYCGGKHGTEGFTESLRTELMHDRSRVRLTMVQLPALNTPQFDWVEAKLPNRPQPVPPIYQPEVAARAIVWAADHPRRELWVGYPTVGAILGNKVIAGLLDRYLAHTGFTSQQTDEPLEEDRPSNLWKPLDGDWGARGRFGPRSRPRSVQWWLNTHRGIVCAGAGLVAALVASARRR